MTRRTLSPRQEADLVEIAALLRLSHAQLADLFQVSEHVVGMTLDPSRRDWVNDRRRTTTP